MMQDLPAPRIRVRGVQQGVILCTSIRDPSSRHAPNSRSPVTMACWTRCLPEHVRSIASCVLAKALGFTKDGIQLHSVGCPYIGGLSLAFSPAFLPPPGTSRHSYCTNSGTMALSKLSVAALLLHLLGTVEASPTARSVAHSTLVSREDLLPEYDYVIVGGGTAGLTVADRLTEDGKRMSPVSPQSNERRSLTSCRYRLGSRARCLP
jgi:hypothetical protein